MSTRSRRWMFRRRVEVGAQFCTTGPVMDPDTVQAVADRLELRPTDPPVYLEITPPFTEAWVKRLESVGAIPISDELRHRLRGLSGTDTRAHGWRVATEASQRAREAGFAGILLMGLRFHAVVGEAYDVWHA